MSTNKIEAKDLLMAYLNNRPAPPTPAEVASDAFYVEFLSDKPAEDIPTYEYVINNLKASAQRQIS